jgi:hypothetical protein
MVEMNQTVGTRTQGGFPRWAWICTSFAGATILIAILAVGIYVVLVSPKFEESEQQLTGEAALVVADSEPMTPEQLNAYRHLLGVRFGEVHTSNHAIDSGRLGERKNSIAAAYAVSALTSAESGISNESASQLVVWRK